MARPKTNQAQELFAYQLHREGHGPTAIGEILTKKFGSELSVSARTIATWVKRFRDPSSYLDEDFEWHRIEEYGLPLDSSEYLLKLWRSFKEWQRSTGIQPSVRQLLWWWRVHNACPPLHPQQVIDVAQRFIVREMATDITGKPKYMKDLEGWVAYRGWDTNPETNAYGRKRYLWAIENGIVPPLRPLDEEISDVYDVADFTGNLAEVDMYLDAIGISEDFRELMPGRQWGIEEGDHKPPGQN